MFVSSWIVIPLLCFCSLHRTFGQDCPSRQELQGTLKQVQKLLSAYEASNLQSLRNLKKKINLLQSTMGKQTTKATNSTCPKLEGPVNGRKLGRSQSVGHEVHFLCDPGYELVGSESRVCQESLTWSGQQSTCRDINECACSPCLNGGTCVDEVNKFSCVCAKGWAGATCQSTAQTNTNACACSPCLNGGTCLDDGQKFSCVCAKGWTGATCQSRVPKDTNACACSPCLNGGTCVKDGKTFSCVCAKDWTGATCQSPAQTDTNACACSPCLNGGTCVEEGKTFSCVCAKGWAGATCQSSAQTDTNACACSPCLNGGSCVEEGKKFSCVCAKGWAGATCQNPVPKFFVLMTNTSAATSAASNAAAAVTLPAATSGPFVRPSRCTITQGTTHCTCDPGYTISGRDNTCIDIDECELFHNGQAGRLCLHACVNTAGGYRCSCPVGYNATRDGRSCKDIDECATRQNNCTKDQMCINTYGGFQCVRVDCPKIPHATYVKTSPMRCERNPCPLDNRACSQTPNSFSYHYLAVVSNLSAPRVMFRVSALRPTGDTLRFSLLGGKLARRHFTVQRSDRQTGQLMLVSPVQGPATLEAEVEMSELEKGVQLGRFITKVTMFVSQYEF